MARFVIDEDMPRSTGVALVEEDYEVKDVWDHGHRGSSDEEIYRFAQEQEAILLTGDLGFGNILKFPLGQHSGIVVARFPNEMPSREINREIVASLRDLGEEDFRGNLIILEPGRIRIRRSPPWALGVLFLALRKVLAQSHSAVLMALGNIEKDIKRVEVLPAFDAFFWLLFPVSRDFHYSILSSIALSAAEGAKEDIPELVNLQNLTTVPKGSIRLQIEKSWAIEYMKEFGKTNALKKVQSWQRQL